MFRQFVLMGAAICLVACTNNSEDIERTGPWILDASESGMTYVTVKNGDLGEINTFREISGVVTPQGVANFEINMESVDTNNDTRDPRMRDHVFKTSEYPVASAKAEVDMAAFEGLKVGESETVLLDLTLSLAGFQSEQDFYVQVTRLGLNKVVVSNKAPLLLDATEFGMEEGLETLRGLAGLDQISPVVPVTLSLTFER